jgi:hypothetical protein
MMLRWINERDIQGGVRPAQGGGGRQASGSRANDDDLMVCGFLTFCTHAAVGFL